jgi:tetratricopeptide (TPR) repeat protein
MRATLTFLSGRAAATCAVLPLIAACATRPEFGMEAPGRPAVTWQSEDTGRSAAREGHTEKDVEQQLLADLREAERKGGNDLQVARTLYNLAIVRRRQGEFTEAERLYRRALEIREREQGPNHPDVAVVLNNLAGLEAAQGHYDAARPLLERALTIRQATLGDAHVLTAQSLNNLALLYAAQGNAAAAEPLYQRALSILQKASVPDENGPQRDGSQGDGLDRVLDNYAALLHETGRDAEADKLETRARVIRAAKEAHSDSAR